MMKSMGWKEGEGLGRGSDGRREPVMSSIKNNRAGLGSASTDKKIPMTRRDAILDKTRERYEQVIQCTISFLNSNCPDLCVNATTVDDKLAIYYSFRPAFAQYVGVLIGNIILGYVADQIGRRKTFLFSMILGIPALSLSAAFDSIAMFYFLRAVTGIAIAGYFMQLFEN
uniref:G-patch domain-containing protein n=1 Tax=Heterorhabditis bacteriophora TaxID=37862 RepID=A0A1I7X0C2_HETBA